MPRSPVTLIDNDDRQERDVVHSVYSSITQASRQCNFSLPPRLEWWRILVVAARIIGGGKSKGTSRRNRRRNRISHTDCSVRSKSIEHRIKQFLRGCSFYTIILHESALIISLLLACSLVVITLTSPAHQQH